MNDPYNFLRDCKILHSHGAYHLAVYCGDRLVIVGTDGYSIGTLGSFVEVDGDGRVSDAYYLLDWLGEKFMELQPKQEVEE